MESLEEIFNRHINSSILETKPINNAMLEGMEFFDPKILSFGLSRIFHDIFSQRSWKYIGNGRVKHTHKNIIVEVHNKYNTLNSREKYESIKRLKQLDSKVKIYGCIYEKEPRDEMEGGVRVITGDLFLRFMLGDEAESVQKRIRYLIKEFYHDVLKPWLRYKLQCECHQALSTF